MLASNRNNNSCQLPRLATFQLAARPTQVKNAVLNGRKTGSAGAVRQRGSALISHVHPIAVVLLSMTIGSAPVALSTSTIMATRNPPTTGTGMSKRASQLMRRTRNSPNSSTGAAPASSHQGEIVMRG
jgi:hypothetical protein